MHSNVYYSHPQLVNNAQRLACCYYIMWLFFSEGEKTPNNYFTCADVVEETKDVGDTLTLFGHFSTCVFNAQRGRESKYKPASSHPTAIGLQELEINLCYREPT